MTNDSSDRFFDISIMDKDGNEIQPAAEVSVEIRLLDTEIVENMQVVHFGKTAELMDLKRDLTRSTSRPMDSPYSRW